MFAEHNIDTVDQENINQALQHFSFTCKTFMTAMAIKHQLQYSLFSGTYYFNDSSGILIKVISNKGIRKLVSALKYIEILTSILQNIEVHVQYNIDTKCSYVLYKYYELPQNVCMAFNVCMKTGTSSAANLAHKNLGISRYDFHQLLAKLQLQGINLAIHIECMALKLSEYI